MVPCSLLLVKKHGNDGFVKLVIDLNPYKGPATVDVIGPERLEEMDPGLEGPAKLLPGEIFGKRRVSNEGHPSGFFDHYPSFFGFEPLGLASREGIRYDHDLRTAIFPDRQSVSAPTCLPGLRFPENHLRTLRNRGPSGLVGTTEDAD